MTTVRDIADAIERTAPLRMQDDFDNSGLQLGFPGAEVSKVLVCLDITEAVVEEAAQTGCNMIVSHHPLLFHPLKQVSDATWQQRCVVKALAGGTAVYSAHTSLDNAPGGVNHEIASRLGLQELRYLAPKDADCGSGLIGRLPAAMTDSSFLSLLQRVFDVSCLRHSAACGREVSTVALCGGAGAFLMREAIKQGADCFISGEFHYHDFFDNDGMLLAQLGHYESEQCTVDLLCRILKEAFPGLEVRPTRLVTNPIFNMIRQ